MNDEKNLTVKEAFDLAVQKHQDNNLQDAQNYYQKVLKIDPNYVSALNNLGIIFQDLEENQKATECFEKAVKINPNYADAHNNLGLIYNKLNDYQNAKECFEKAIEINPNHSQALNNIAGIFINLKDIQKAKKCYEKVLQIDPNNIQSINALSSLLSAYAFEYKSEVDKDSFKKLILFLFRKKNISLGAIVKNVILILLSKDDTVNLLKIINSESSLLTNEIAQNLLKEELFHLMLQKAIIPDKFLEKLLTQLRCEILFNLEISNKDNLDENFNFIISLAEQCWLNEYVYAQSEKEINQIIKLKNKIENDNSINEIEIAILGCYIPLNKSKIIIEKLFNYKSTNILFNDLINVQIKEPLSEKELAKSIKSLDVIKDLTSKKVQEQYEEHPYPKWRHTNKSLSKDFFFLLNSEIMPNRIIYNDKFANPNVLIAGCGTGKHSISATQYKNANILGVDLSKSSLAYAKRKTDELGYKSIEYLHADILQLKKLDRKFDIIECGGTLHHMKDPIAGLKVLLDVLEPHGFLKLGLYSDTARQDVVRARNFIQNKNYKKTTIDIKNFRQDIINNKKDSLMENVTIRNDFYSTSTVRDLLFHVQEHRFTIPEISKILKDLNLEFLGFFYSNPLIKIEYLKLFPNDKRCTSLDNWHQFEISNPKTFQVMYQFWVKKL